MLSKDTLYNTIPRDAVIPSPIRNWSVCYKSGVSGERSNAEVWVRFGCLIGACVTRESLAITPRSQDYNRAFSILYIINSVVCVLIVAHISELSFRNYFVTW